MNSLRKFNVIYNDNEIAQGPYSWTEAVDIARYLVEAGYQFVTIGVKGGKDDASQRPD